MRTVLISGAGVAGLSLAYWLRQHGFHPTLVERAPGPRQGGQAVDLRGAAREVVARMGLLDEVRAAHTGIRGIAWVDERGRRAAEMAADALGDSGGVVADLEILRSDLVRILHDAAGVDIEYRTEITALDEKPDGIRAAFARGPARTFDVVVGADGIGSGVRSLVFGPDSVRDLGYHLGYFPARTRLDLDGWETVCNLPAGNGVGGRVVMLYPLGASGECRVLVGFVSPKPLAPEENPAAVVAEAFAGAGWEIPALLEQLPDDLYFSRAGEVRLTEWHRGRTVLLGDAAFGGSLGMGTSLALVGAYVLAGELSTVDDPRTAFARYADEMRDYVAANRKRPPGGARGFAPRTRTGIRLRNAFLRALPHLPGRHRMLGGLQRSANAITLKPYPALRP
ncbi:FAD-dependent monooxygenase [Amycolatopsis sp. VS8301801F10]|uniref:FAD-dependent monooxygenase n=1 Tax=Amycolatopsis sp. VS8301801F10 TaxID=2652442 RepID=UPI0038FD0549